MEISMDGPTMESVPNPESEEFRTGREVKRWSKSRGAFEDGWKITSYDPNEGMVSLIKATSNDPNKVGAVVVRVTAEDLRKWNS